jgi:equilibrative nucleoside transporter 1/2/3
LWINRTTLILLILTALLTLSTFTHLAPGVQFTFVILNGIAQAAAGAYMQTAGVVVASLFGPWAMQTMMAGNAAVGVVVSAVQAIAAAASVWGLPDDMIASYKIDSSAEERAAFIFFGLSTLFLAGALFANQWFFATPAYRALVMPSAHKYEEESLRDSEEHEGLVSRSGGREVEESDKALKIMRVAKANVIYEIAVAFVFIVTLVSNSTCAFCEISSPPSPCFLQ